MKHTSGACRPPLLWALLLPLLWRLVQGSRGPAPAATAAGAGAPAALGGRSAEEFVHGLEANVRRVLGHLRADRSLAGEEAKQRDRVAGLLQGALASQGGVFLHALALHKALWAAEGFLLRRTKELSTQHARLSGEVADQQARILYAMLKQRRRLPMKSQVVLLRRKQFANCTVAQQLLRRHRDGTPLYRQLEQLLPPALARQLAGPQQQATDHLAVRGSEGRVHVVSSRLKNDVRKMEGELRRGRDLIAQLLARGAVRTGAETTQARGALADLDKVLHKAEGTHDLKAQLDAMYEVRDRMVKWMQVPAS